MTFCTAGFIIFPVLLPELEAPSLLFDAWWLPQLSHVNITFCQAR